MNGSYLRFLPRQHRLDLVDGKAKKTLKKKKQNDHLTFTYMKYLVSYAIRLQQEHQIDKTLLPFQDVKLVEGNTITSPHIHTPGLPLPQQQIYEVICRRKFDFKEADLPLSRFVYILSESAFITDNQFPFSLKEATYQIFFRTLEGGTMIKIKQKTPEMPVIHHMSSGQPIEYSDTREIDRDLYKSFFDKINAVVSDFFDVLNFLSKSNTQYQTLNDIIRKAAEYDYLRVEETKGGSIISKGHPLKVVSKSTAKQLKNAQPIMQSCKVSGCSMMDNNEAENDVYALYLHKNVLDDITIPHVGMSFKHADPRKYSYGFKMCKPHGMIVITMWYLLNQIGIMTTDILKVIGIMTPTTFKYQKKTVHSHYCKLINPSAIDKIVQAKKRLDCSLLFIAEWTNQHRPKQQYRPKEDSEFEQIQIVELDEYY
jgi:hypothetical protein